MAKTQSKIELTKEQKNKIRHLFGYSNKKLIDNFNLFIKKYNYSM
jgi:hypothetical protein